MYQKYQLKNGLRVILAESQKSPVVSVQMWVKTGSADEQRGEEGISHFIEHLVFKGTEKFGVGQIASTVEGSGGELNAYTSFDQTVFYVTISKDFADVGLDCISQMMGFPKFDPAEIDREREVVVEEIKRTLDNPHRQASQQLFSTVFKKHPYGRPVIGYDKVIKKVSRDTLVNYYRRRYVPENMTLVVTGAIDKKSIKDKIKKYYAAIPKFKLKKISRPKESAQSTQRRAVQNWKFEENLFYVSWPIPNAKHADIPALDVLSLILGSGESSRLNHALRLEKSLVNYIGASSFTPQDPGFFMLSASLQVPKMNDALEELLIVLDKFLATGPSWEEMEKALVAFESEEFYAMETVDGLARKVGHFEQLFGDYKYFEKFLKLVRKVTPADVLRVARKYLIPKTMTVVMSSTKDAKAAKQTVATFEKNYAKMFKKVAKAKAKIPKRSKSFGKLKLSSKHTAKANQIHRFRLLDGVDLIVRPNHDTPVIHARLAYLSGVRSETRGTLGLTELASRVWSARTRGLSERELNEKIETHASSLSSFGGRNTVGLQLTTLSRFQQPMRDILAEFLIDPFITEDIIAREKLFMLEQQRKRDDNPAQKAILQFMSALFGAHPYAMDPLGTKESVSNLSLNLTENYLTRFRNQEGLKIVVAGDVDVEEWREFFAKKLSRLPDAPTAHLHFEFKPPVVSQILFTELDKEQTHILVGYPGLTFLSPEKHALEVATSILAGQGGRLFLELRDKESLAYSVSPMKMEGIETGYFGGYIACSPEKAEKAVQMLKAEFKKIAEKKVSDSELDRAQRYLIGRHDIELQRSSAVGSSILFDALYGLAPEEPFHYAEKIRAVTSQQVREVCAQIFSRPEVISVVGRRKPDLG